MPRCACLAILIAAALIGQVAAAQAVVIYVRIGGNDLNAGTSWQAAKKTISAAMEAASPGDQVWVGAGTYSERIVLRDGVALCGGFPPDGGDWESRNPASNVTVIDGSQAGQVVAAAYGAGPDTRIDGFTITGGRADVGAGVYCFGSSPTISGNRIVSNSTAGYNGYGGGICCENASPVITGNVIQSNYAVVGGGIFVASDSQPVISSNTITGNIASRVAGVYCADYSAPVISDNTISGTGGGIYCEWHADAAVSGNTVTGCSAPIGAGLYSLHSAPTVSGNTFSANTASQAGGAICGEVSAMQVFLNRMFGNRAPWGAALYFVHGSDDIVSNNIISGNNATYGGGGVLCSYCSPDIANNTFVANSGPYYGGGASFFDSACAFSNNIVAYGSSGLYRDSSTSRFPSLASNCVYGTTGQAYIGLAPGVGDISSDPLFANRAGGDYHLTSRSPCINAGAGAAAGVGSPDFDGLPRVWAGVVDIGAHEFRAEPCSPAAAKDQPDTTWIAVSGVVTGVFNGSFYIQEQDRISGIRAVLQGSVPAEGLEVIVCGPISVSTSGERYIDVSTVTITGGDY